MEEVCRESVATLGQNLKNQQGPGRDLAAYPPWAKAMVSPLLRKRDELLKGES